MRERVLTDLTERRQELERQIGDLRGTRAKLVDAYEAVERALGQATNLMAQETPVRVPVPPSVDRARRPRSTTTAPTTTAPEGDSEPVDAAPVTDTVDVVAEPE